jgi:hypothetical protein
LIPTRIYWRQYPGWARSGSGRLIAFYWPVVRVLATMKTDNEPHYKEVLKQYPIPE